MKSIITLSAFLISLNSFSQVEQAQIGAEFKAMAGSVSPGALNVAGIHMDGMQTYSSNEIDGSQFFYPTWSSGSVTTIQGETLNLNYSFLYDKVRQQLFMKWKDTSLILLAEKASIKSFSLNQNGITINFLSSTFFDHKDSSNFYQVLSSNASYTLLKLTKTIFEKADYSDIQKVKDGDIHDAFVDKIEYYISYNNEELKQITTKEKSLEKAFPELKQKISDFYNKDANNVNSDEFLMSFIQSLN